MNGTLVQLTSTALIACAGIAWSVVATSRPVSRSLAWRVVAAGLTIVAVGTVLWAWGAGGWWFVGEKVTVYVPLASAALAWFVVALRRENRTTDAATAVPVAAWSGVIAAAAGLLTQFAVGFPAPAWSIGAVILLAIGASALAAALLRGGARRPVAVAGAGVGAVVVVATAIVVVSAAGPGALAAHAHAHEPAAAEVGESASDPASVSVTSLRTPVDVPADVHVELEAQTQSVTLPSGAVIDAWTFGELGGPTIEAMEGDVVEVVLHNRDIGEGVTAHWHGYAVPNGEDGVAGVTQDAVRPGESFTYRFDATRPGTYWYHTHQRSSTGVVRGLYGGLVVSARDEEPADVDVTLALHTFADLVVLGASDELQAIAAVRGDAVRVRVVNTDQVPQLFAVNGTPFRVVAIDGQDVGDPALVQDLALRIPAGGRYDVMFEMPDHPVDVRVAASRTAVVVFGGESAAEAAEPRYDREFDPLTYGAADGSAADAGSFDVERTLVLDRLPRLVGGMPGYAYTVDGLAYPHIPPTLVREGDRVKLTVVNRGFETHPMHPHGHHVRVLSVNGRAPTGSPVVLDTFDVHPGETWEVALVADNPGIWMDHCHNLDHAALGMVTHLVYKGITTPFEHGGVAGNAPE